MLWAALSSGMSVMAPITCRDPGGLWSFSERYWLLWGMGLFSQGPFCTHPAWALCPYPKLCALGEESVDSCRHGHSISGHRQPAGVLPTYPPTQSCEPECPVGAAASTSVNTECASGRDLKKRLSPCDFLMRCSCEGAIQHF